MTKNRIALSSLAMDLKRVAVGYYRGSDVMAERFLQEALKRKAEIDQRLLKPYIRDILNKITDMHRKQNKRDVAEDALMYSTLLQNASLKL